MDEASCPSRWYYTYLFITLHSPLATEVGLAVPPKLGLPLGYRGVPPATVQGGDYSVTVAWSLLYFRLELPPCICSAPPEQKLGIEVGLP